MPVLGFTAVFEQTQHHLATQYSAALSDPNKFDQIKPYIRKFLRDNALSVVGYTVDQLADELYREMVEYSFLTDYLYREDVEEININSWDDVAITYTDGRIEKIRHFYSPQHSIDIVKRLLANSNMQIDDAVPMAQGHLPNNTRITALKTPLVDPDIGMAASIRILHHTKVNASQLIGTGTSSAQMFDFLCVLLRYGVSFVIAGATSSGKTTLLNAILSTIPDGKRIFTIESGARELSLVRRDDEGNIVNNVVHTLSRPSSKEDNDISQEDLVVASLRYNPDVVVVGEMRDTEAYSAVEAALTGHTVVSTIHAFAADAAHMRLALLCQKRFPIDFKLSLMQAAQAFPVVVYEHKLEDNSRKIMDITECIVDEMGNRQYRPLFQYVITSNKVVDGQYQIEGSFRQIEIMSENLQRKLIHFGVPQHVLQGFLDKDVPYTGTFRHTL